jgi:P pilus assembly chaperone PapD
MLRKLMLVLSGLILLAAGGAALQISQIEFDLQVNQGESYNLTFYVKNDAETSQTVVAYLGDWDRDIDGKNRFYKPGTIARSLCAWLDVEPKRVTLESGEVQRYTATLTIPPREEIPLDGTYWGIIFVQGEPRPVNQGGTTVMAIERFGIKVYATIAGTERSSGEVEKLEVSPTSGGYSVTVYYTNTGNVHQRVTGTVAVLDRTGNEVETIPLPEFPILPGATRRLTAELPALSRGVYLVQAVLDYGGEVKVAGLKVLRIR